VNWTVRGTPDGRNWHVIEFLNGYFIASRYNAATDTTAVMTSLDGIDWTINSTPSMIMNARSIASGVVNGQPTIVVVGSTSNVNGYLTYP
jgi:hypothetical protein